jgi:hypothetical protein
MANLFIAMGGSGVKTLKHIRNKHRKGDYFLFIDTDTNDLVDERGNAFSDREKIDLSTINVTTYLNMQSSADPIRKRVDEWMDLSARTRLTNGPLKEGASALRPQGRLAIAQIHNQFKSQIHSLVESIFKDDENDAQTNFNIFIVLSVAGGTGSSIYLDLTKVLYDKLYEKLPGKFNKPTVLLYMPDAFVSKQKPENVDRYKTNVFAFWKELDALQRDYFGSIDFRLLQAQKNISSNDLNSKAIRSTYFEDFSVIPDKFTAGILPFEVFESGILIDHKNSDGNLIPIDTRYKQVARLLEMISIRTHGGAIKSALNNATRDNAVNSISNGHPWVKQYWSAGYAEIKGGSDLFREYVEANIKRLVFENFVGNGATKDKLDESVKPLFQDHLLSYIERDTYNGYMNKAKEENGKPMNLHSIFDKYWAENINQNLETQYADGVELKDNDESAEGLIRLFDNDIKDKVSLKLLEFLKISGFNLDEVINKILAEFYQNCTEIALTDGLQRLGFVLEALDTKIDDLSMLYDAEMKTLADKKTNIIIDNQEIVNRNLADTIIAQYAVVKEGPSALTFKKTQWYENELTNLKNLIRAYFTYQSEELALKLKKEICDKISLSKLGNMRVRDNVSKLISSLTTKIETEIRPNAHKHLINNYLTYKDNALSSVIPDVSKFSETNAFDDSKKNVFKSIFENKCGLATGTLDGKSFIVTKISQKTDDNTKTIEDLIRIVFNNSKFLITNVQSGSISYTKFVEELDKLIDENLISKLTTILTNGQSKNNEPSGYPKYVTYTLNDWINEDSESFNSIKKKFDSRASVFCHFKNEISPSQLWVSPISLKNRINEIYSAEGNTNIPAYEHRPTDEDAIVSIKYIANLSFDDYSMYELYRNHYRICLSSNPNNFSPHIDVRFKEAMLQYLYNVEDHTPIINKLAQVASVNRKSSDTIGLNIDKGKEIMKKYLESYSYFFFLSIFYKKLDTPEYNTILGNLVMANSEFKQYNINNTPIFLENDQIKVINTSGNEQLKAKGIIWLEGKPEIQFIIEKLSQETLNERFQETVLFAKEPKEMQTLLDKESFRKLNYDCIKKRYTLMSDKILIKKAISETIDEVKSNLSTLRPVSDDFKAVFDDYVGSFINELNKLIN